MSRGRRVRAWGSALGAALLAHGIALAWLQPTCDRSGLRGERGAADPVAGVRLALRAAPAPKPSPRPAREMPPPAVERPAAAPARTAPPPHRRMPAEVVAPPPAVSAAPDPESSRAESIDGPAPESAVVETSLAEAAAGGLPGDPGASARAREAYEDLLSRRVQGCLRYPRRALRARVEGDADLTLTISPDGRLADATLDRSTGSAVLDRDALDTVRRCVPYPPPPAGGSDRADGRYAIRVGYELR